MTLYEQPWPEGEYRLFQLGFIVDDLLPQTTWPPSHQHRVDTLLAHLPEVPNLRATPMRWASRLLLGART